MAISASAVPGFLDSLDGLALTELPVDEGEGSDTEAAPHRDLVALDANGVSGSVDIVHLVTLERKRLPGFVGVSVFLCLKAFLNKLSLNGFQSCSVLLVF